MRAVVYTAPLELKVMDVPEPVAGPGEVIVDVRAVGICGSELEGFASRSPFRVPPLIMGHEFAGTRVDTGERVVVNPVVSCLVCDLCSRGLVNVCRKREILGIQRPGGYAERVAVPAENCLTVPADAPFTSLALTEPLANAVHAVRLVQAHDPWPQRIGIIGSGTLGLAVGLVAKSRGVPHIEISDLSAARLAAAERAGLTPVDGALAGEYDAVFDTVGSAATRGASLTLIRPGGSAVWIGLHGPEADLDGQAMIRREVRVLTTFCYDRTDFAVAAGLAPTLRPDWVATHPLADGDKVFRGLLDGPVAAVKSMLVR
ncbi:alcohol dehydrogenase catalytic domain-containing protein [Rhizomonospora bruguierae]|uniref:alcohol dehydrogenase catalytic domain-containing protein n=1 Tax=Rhizomonospora bruguierae TaxID=1581705 RepID=UPI001BCBBCEF|nr:alcohol dehydrogenase catalytic domain-containing protein [Micromonospora sp. NBRC 107566]